MKYSKEEVQFLIKNYSDKGLSYCAKKLGRSIPSVAQKAKNLKLRVYNKKDSINIEQFIKITKPEVVYFLGFMWADGWVAKRYVTCEIVEKDFLDIENVFNEIGDWYVYKVKVKNNEKPRIKAGRYDNELAKVFLDLGFREKSKSFSAHLLSLIPEKLLHYFWRGYFDGDGSIYFSYTGQYVLTISSTFLYNWIQLEKTLKELRIPYIINRISRKDGRVSVLKIQNKENFIKFLSYIYNGMKKDKIGLKRKYKQFIDGSKQIQNRKTAPSSRRIGIDAYDDSGKKIGRFRSIIDAARKLGLKKGKIYSSLNKGNGECQGFKFKRVERKDFLK